MTARRDLGLFLGARVLGTLGIQVQSVAVAWQVYSRTEDPLDLGLVGLSQFLPLALLSLYAGGVADRFDRKRILVACRFGYALGALALALLSRRADLGVAPIYAVLVALGAIRAFASPAAVALLPGLVSDDELPRAIALSSTMFQIGTIAGPALGGIVYAAAGAEAAYQLASGLELASGLAVLAILTPLPVRAAVKERGATLLLSGVRYVLRERVLLGAISLDLFAVLLGGAVALMPIYARDILHVGEAGLGMLRAAPALGAAVMAVTLAFFPLRRRAGVILFASVGLFGLATVVFGLSEDLWLSLAALVVLGAADMVSVVVRQSLVQIRTPDAWRGRVASVNMIFIGGSNELGELESGLTAAWLGAVRAVVVGGVGTLVVTGVWAALFPSLRRIDSLSELAPPAPE